MANAGAPSNDLLRIKQASAPENCWKPKPGLKALSTALRLWPYIDAKKASSNPRSGGTATILDFLQTLLQHHMTIAAVLDLVQLPQLHQIIKAIQRFELVGTDDTWTTGSFKFNSEMSETGIATIATSVIVREIDKSANANRPAGLGATPAWPAYIDSSDERRRVWQKYASALALVEWVRRERGENRKNSTVKMHSINDELTSQIERIREAHPEYDNKKVHGRRLLPDGNATTNHAEAVPTDTEIDQATFVFEKTPSPVNEECVKRKLDELGWDSGSEASDGSIVKRQRHCNSFPGEPTPASHNDLVVITSALAKFLLSLPTTTADLGAGKDKVIARLLIIAGHLAGVASGMPAPPRFWHELMEMQQAHPDLAPMVRE